jgi:hypothetical protein
MQRVRNVVALSLLMAVGLRADIVPLEGAQRMEGRVRVVGALLDESDGFDLSAPNALASWAPSSVFIEEAWDPCRVTVQTTYGSEISPASMNVATSAEVRSTGNIRTGGPWAEFAYWQTFSMRFEITSPARYRIEASVRRFNHTGWGERSPAMAVFAREGDPGPAIVRLVIPAFHEDPVEFAVVQSRLLAAGIYYVEILDANSYGVYDYIIESSVSFSLECACDWDESGLVDSQDFFAFLADFFESAADFDGDGVTNSQDFFEFLGCFFAGC